MTRRKMIVAAYLLDCMLGDPEWFPHPVRLMGRCCTSGEAMLRRLGNDVTDGGSERAAYELVAGGALTVAIVAGSYSATDGAIRWARAIDKRAGVAIELLLAWTCLAGRSLDQEGSAVVRELEAAVGHGGLEPARARLARVVGRDTGHLDEGEICRAVIETVAESASDGVVAPLFYMALGGVPLAMAYKAVNTLDSMIGHADERYLYFGKAAARLDDAANFVPARLTAGAIAAVAAVSDPAAGERALAIWRRDGDKHKSPNAGQPESAMAGALEVRLGGENRYGGEAIDAPLMGAEFPAPCVPQAKQALRIVAAVAAMGVFAALLLTSRRKR
ncbi:MAG TPA: adenosylcobinamide-phosphate synthase CbiB [Granulicella sp.]|jgi:adenosylcobinamide-phosphate synthase|nr:adenosylcobinamide-phosphate synthase CbiB [Granulicella sp.]